MIGLNYTITSNGTPIPLGTPVVVVVNGATAHVNPDTVNAGRYNVEYPAPGPTTIAVLAAGFQPLIFNDTIPESGGEAPGLVLLPL